MGDLTGDAKAADEDAANDAARARHERTLAEVRRDRDSARQALRQVTGQRDDLAAQLALVTSIVDLNPKPPRWLTRKRKASERHGTITTILSDTHFDEVVNPDEIGGVNAYSRDIATVRLRAYFDQLVMVARDMMAGVTFDGAVLMLGGDLVSGAIHEELAQTNEDSTLGTCLYWSEMICAGVAMLADEFGAVHIPVVPGNHGSIPELHARLLALVDQPRPAIR